MQSYHLATTIENQFYPVGIVLSEWSLPASNGGVMPYDYTLTPTLPKGLTLNESTRTISGTPSNITPETLYTWAVEDATGMVASLKFNLEVYALSFSESIDDQSYSRGQAIPPLILPEVTGGRTPIQYTLNLFDLPIGLMFDVSARIISGTPMVISPPVPFTYMAVDTKGVQDSLNCTIEVVSPVIRKSKHIWWKNLWCAPITHTHLCIQPSWCLICRDPLKYR